MRTSIDVITTQERRVQNSRQSGMQSSTYSASNTSYHQCYFYCACYVSGNSVTIFFFQNKSTAPRILGSAFCFRISEIAQGFRPMRNRKIFQRIISGYWMRSSMIWRILADRSVCYAPHRHECSHSHERQLKPLVFITFFFLSICFKLENKLTSIYVKLPSS